MNNIQATIGRYSGKGPRDLPWFICPSCCRRSSVSAIMDIGIFNVRVVGYTCNCGLQAQCTMDWMDVVIAKPPFFFRPDGDLSVNCPPPPEHMEGEAWRNA